MNMGLLSASPESCWLLCVRGTDPAAAARALTVIMPEFAARFTAIDGTAIVHRSRTW